MSHVAAAGSISVSKNMAGKRLGVKKFAGEKVKTGNIIIRQRGSVYHAGKNTLMSKDYTIHALKDGIVAFRKMSGHKRGKYFVDVLE